jgi:AAA domain (dynein-related subfamily)
MNQAVSMSQAIACLEAYTDAGTPVMCWGPPGIGKTQIAHQLAAKKSIPIIDWRANLRDPVDARGLPVPDLKAGTTRWLRPEELPLVGSKHGKKGIFLLDEINTASPSMMNVCLQIVLEGRVGEHVFEPDWVCVGTGNRAQDKAVVGRMSSALKNRFAHLEIEPEIDAWINYALTCPEITNNPMAAYVVAFLRFCGKDGKNFLHRMPVDDTVNAFPTPRQWFEVMKFLNQPATIRPHLIGGLIGHDIAVELEGFLRICHELPTLDEVVANPATAKLPKAPGSSYAVAGMIARGATSKTFGKILTYAKRLGREVEALAALDSTRYTPGLRNTEAFANWAVANQDLVV